MEVERVAVIGAGTMGRGIAHAAALGGFRVTLQDVDSGMLERALEGIQKGMRKAVERDRLLEGEMRGGLERISPTESLEEAVEDADLVGLDARLRNLEYLHQTLGEKYRPSPLLYKLVAAGHYGRKSGRGIYEYYGDGNTVR